MIWGFTGIDNGLLEDWYGHLKVLTSNPKYRENIELDAFSFEVMRRKKAECARLVRDLAEKRQIEIVGGSYTAPPMIIIDGESNLRQILLGKELLKEILGVAVTSFAVQEGVICCHPQILQILAGTGYENCVLGCFSGYSFVDAAGIDGTVMPTVVKSYWDALPRDPNNLREIMTHCRTGKIVMPMPDWSWGAAETEWIKEAEKLTDLRIVTVSEFFDRNRPKEKLLLSEAEWNSNTKIVDLGAPRALCLLDIANGCEIPMAIKYAENLLLTTETYACIASSYGINAKTTSLKTFWKNLLKAQAHDVYFDGSILELKGWGMRLCEHVNKKAHSRLSRILTAIAHRVDTQTSIDKRGLTPVIIYNQLPWQREELVELKLDIKEPRARSIELLDKNGNAVTWEALKLGRHRNGNLREIRVRFLASLPSMGYTTYYVNEVCGTESAEDVRTRRVESKSVGNEFVKITCNEEGEVTAYEKNAQVRLLKTGFITLKDQDGYDDSRHYSVETHVQKGSLTSQMTIEGRLRRAFYKTAVQVSENSPRVSFETVLAVKDAVIGENVDWWCMRPETGLANNFIFDIANGTLTHDFPFGSGQSRSSMIFPLNWIDYSNKDIGVSIFHSGTHGFWVKEVSPLQLLNLWLWSRIRLGEKFTRKGLAPCTKTYVFRYSIVPHGAEEKGSSIIRKAAEYRSPPIAVTTYIHPGKLPEEKSFMNIDHDNIVLSALAPHPNGMLARFFEADGKETHARIRTSFPDARRFFSATMSGEKKPELLEQENGVIFLHVRPFEIATLLLAR